MKDLVLGLNEWLKTNHKSSKRVNEAAVPDWELAAEIPAGMSLPALISKLQDLEANGAKQVKFREEPNGQMTVWSQTVSDIDDTDFDDLPFGGGEPELGAEPHLGGEPEFEPDLDQEPEFQG